MRHPPGGRIFHIAAGGSRDPRRRTPHVTQRFRIGHNAVTVASTESAAGKPTRHRDARRDRAVAQHHRVVHQHALGAGEQGVCVCLRMECL
eukprot:ctg_204.g153